MKIYKVSWAVKYPHYLGAGINTYHQLASKEEWFASKLEAEKFIKVLDEAAITLNLKAAFQVEIDEIEVKG